MNLAASAPPWLVAALFLFLLAAAIEDGWRMRIANLFSVAIIVGALIAAILAGFPLALWQNGVMFAALLAVGTFLFGAGLLGGGDVKLLASSALWFDFGGGWKMLVAVALAGGLLAIVLLSIRPMISAPGRWTILKKGGGIPYGIAIAGGVAATVALMR
ncbi:prepilin peptidase [Sphingomonas sp.]|uniref:prepilin peptidase n=1 Tax=Sphingomonas sp. TaxID=28214 RepID=UPI00286BA645|nr:prepilin peptidase [Sphingomonas sp.]